FRLVTFKFTKVHKDGISKVLLAMFPSIKKRDQDLCAIKILLQQDPMLFEFKSKHQCQKRFQCQRRVADLENFYLDVSCFFYWRVAFATEDIVIFSNHGCKTRLVLPAIRLSLPIKRLAHKRNMTSIK